MNRAPSDRARPIAGAARYRPDGGTLDEGADTGRIKRRSAGCAARDMGGPK
jgi:hypothetical protein